MSERVKLQFTNFAYDRQTQFAVDIQKQTNTIEALIQTVKESFGLQGSDLSIKINNYSLLPNSIINKDEIHQVEVQTLNPKKRKASNQYFGDDLKLLKDEKLFQENSKFYQFIQNLCNLRTSYYQQKNQDEQVNKDTNIKEEDQCIKEKNTCQDQEQQTTYVTPLKTTVQNKNSKSSTLNQKDNQNKNNWSENKQNVNKSKNEGKYNYEQYQTSQMSNSESKMSQSDIISQKEKLNLQYETEKFLLVGKQVNQLFSDKSYFQNSFLQNEASQDLNKYIKTEILLKFRVIQQLVPDNQKLIEDLRLYNSSIRSTNFELSSDGRYVRKFGIRPDTLKNKKMDKTNLKFGSK